MGGSGLLIVGGDAEITNGTISGNGTGAEIVFPENPVRISQTEISNNDVGMYLFSSSSVVQLDNVSIHDNGTSPASDIIIIR